MNDINRLKNEKRAMNALDKMKADLARYHAALKDIEQGVYHTEPSVIARKALYPEPQVPVTLEDLLVALKKLNAVSAAKGISVLHSIRFFSDRSGYLYAEKEVFSQSFLSFRQALDILNGQINEN